MLWQIKMASNPVGNELGLQNGNVNGTEVQRRSSSTAFRILYFEVNYF